MRKTQVHKLGTEVDRYDMAFGRMAAEARRGNPDLVRELLEQFLADDHQDIKAFSCYDELGKVPLAILHEFPPDILDLLDRKGITLVRDFEGVSDVELLEIPQFTTTKLNKVKELFREIIRLWKASRKSYNDGVYQRNKRY